MPRSSELVFRKDSLDSIPPPLLEFGYLVRTGRPGDEKAWLDLTEGRRLLGLTARDFVRRVLQAPDYDPRGLVFVTIGSRPAGIALAVCSGPGSTAGRLVLFAVKLPHRGRGLGRFLVWRALEYLKELGCVSCETSVRPSQREACRLLRSVGFVRVNANRHGDKDTRWTNRKQQLRARK